MNDHVYQTNSYIAEVHVSNDLDKVLIVPRNIKEKQAVRTKIKNVLPNTQLSMKSGGYVINPHDAIHLFTNLTCLNLKWSVEAKQFVLNRLQIRENYERIRLEVEKIKQNGREAAELMLTGMDIDALDDHQTVNVATMTISDGFGMCIFDEQGAGKTVTAIYAYDVLVERDEIDFALIVAPKSMIAEWPQDIHRFKKNLYKVMVMAGSMAEKRKVLSSRADVVVTNYETVVSMETELIALFRQYKGRCVLIIDESFFVKNKDAKRTQSLKRLREWCGRAFILCGTPAPNSPLDLVEQINLVDMGYAFDGVELPEDRSAAVPIVKQIVETRGLFVRHLKQEVLPDLPHKLFNTVLVQLSPQQRQVYTEALQGYLRDLRNADDATFRKQLSSFLAKRSALLQICSNPSSVVQGYTEIPAKLLVLDDILEELIKRQGEKVVLWSCYRKSIDTIATRYQMYNPVRYDGTVSSVEERRNYVRLFQEDPNTKIFIGNPAAAGAGLTLHRARYAIYESFSDQAAHYLQSLDRIHRRGQEKEVEYIALLADQTIELSQYQIIRTKEEVARDLLGDNIPDSPSRTLFLKEAENAAVLLGLTSASPS